MSRPLRLQASDALYHLTARGNARQEIVFGDPDREDFVGTLDDVVDRYGWLCLSYCLMSNHYHLVVETPKPNLALGMRQLNGVYAQTFNRRHARIGHVFGGRYKAVLVERDAHLLELCRYVVLNPVRAGLCSSPEEWRWSSYRATAGIEPAPEFLRTELVLGLFGSSAASRTAAYRRFCRAGVAQPPIAPEPRAGIYLGSEEFVRDRSRALLPTRDVPRVHWQPSPPTLEELISTHGQAAILPAYREYGYSMREIGKVLGVHESTIGRRLRALEKSEDA